MKIENIAIALQKLADKIDDNDKHGIITNLKSIEVKLAFILEKETVINHTQNNVTIFGEDSKFTFKQLYGWLLAAISIITIVLVTPSTYFKYADITKERDSLKVQLNDYKSFYEYVYYEALDQNNQKEKYYKKVFRKIVLDDKATLRNLEQWATNYAKEMRRKKLKAELKKLSE